MMYPKWLLSCVLCLFHGSGCSDADFPDAHDSVGESEASASPSATTEDDGGDGDDSTPTASSETDASAGSDESTGQGSAESSSSGDSDGDTSTTSSTTASGCTGEKVVHFVYFVENDQPFAESQRQDIENQAFAFQQYWYEQLGTTFHLSEPVVDVIMADHDSNWYITTPDGIHSDDRWYRLGNIKTEVYSKLGIVDFDPDHRVVNYPIVRSDGRVGGNFGGAWMDGDDMTCMSGATGSYPYGDANDAHCLGHAAHEFGHVLSLAHQGPDTDCMQFGFYNSTGGSGMCDFSPDNVSQILAASINNGWFGAMPGDTCAP